MKLGIGVAPFGPKAVVNMDFVRHAESLGYDSAWTAEAYGNDAVSTAAWVLANTTKMRCGTAIMQMPARTPAMAGDDRDDARPPLGRPLHPRLGPSGPQVVEGWHGVPYGKPLTRTREYISIVRQILAREKPVEFHGEHYDIPVTGPGTTGLGKPLKSILHGNRACRSTPRRSARPACAVRAKSPTACSR
jgi:alkanesulfonate monooxygenase SsuD/methylene tetrahydromethanopterin reductase-like flavin-dependent oxidoreductase (luciferase family)